MADEKAPTKAPSKRRDTEGEGDPQAEPGTPEHLGSDTPYVGGKPEEEE